MERLQKYPKLQFGQHLYTEGRIILLDVETKSSFEKSLMSLDTIDKKELIVLDAQTLSAKLSLLLDDHKIYQQPNDVLTVFPGNGSLKPKEFMRFKKNHQTAYAFAKRYWEPGENPQVYVSEIMTDCFIDLKTTNILVIDDVISSGMTMQKLFEHNAWKFPRASWTAATWISQMPRQKAESGINGFSQMITAYITEGPGGKFVPINSLSTLLECPKITQNYALRHFAKPEKFLELLESVLITTDRVQMETNFAGLTETVKKLLS